MKIKKMKVTKTVYNDQEFQEAIKNGKPGDLILFIDIDNSNCIFQLMPKPNLSM